jgi:hypothetical protein
MGTRESFSWVVPLLAMLGAPPGSASPTAHTTDPDTGVESWSIEDRGFAVSLTQMLPDQARAFFLGRGFPRDAAERYAEACVFMTIVRNVGAAPLEFDLRGWRVSGVPGVERLETREAWLVLWQTEGLGESQRIAFEWSQFPTTQSFEPGDWNQGMTTVKARPATRFDLELRWRSHGECQVAMLEGVRCAAR